LKQNRTVQSKGHTKQNKIAFYSAFKSRKNNKAQNQLASNPEKQRPPIKSSPRVEAIPLPGEIYQGKLHSDHNFYQKYFEIAIFKWIVKGIEFRQN